MTDTAAGTAGCDGMCAKCAGLEALAASLRKENHELRKRDIPLPNSGYEWLTNLQYRNKALSDQLCDFKSGEKYAKMQAEHKSQIAAKDREIRGLKASLASANAQVVTVRNNWMEIIDEMEKEHAKEISRKDREMGSLKEGLLGAHVLFDAERDKYREKCKELYEVRTELEEAEGRIQKLKAQINRDHETSSKPSSMVPNRKKIIANSREKTGKKPGGQPGHAHHPRKIHVPTATAHIPAPDEYSDSPDYVPTGRTITKQLVDIRVETVVMEFSTPEYRNVRTGQRVHAEFPGGLVDDVTYGGNIKGLAFLLNNYCNVSVDKTSELIREMTGGLTLSAGMINGLAGEFSRRTEAWQGKVFAGMLLDPVMNADFTPVRMGGANMQVIVCATPSGVLYFPRGHKGHEGIKGTPVEGYQFILVHDHDKTFYKYGSGHQECLQHVLRYLKDSIANEPHLKWNGLMWGLIREMIHFTNGLDPGNGKDPDEIDPERVSGFEGRYDEILALAKSEYEYEPPSKYYTKGHSLYLRMLEYRESHLLFLHDRRVPPTNNLAERKLRLLKRKMRQVMTFRSVGGLAGVCAALGAIEMMRMRGKNLFDSVAAIFGAAGIAAG